MKKLNQFDNIINVLKNMPADKKDTLIKAHNEFHRLKSLCEAKKEIEVMPKMTGIRVIKRTEKTNALKAVIEYLKPAGFKWEDTQ